MNDDYLKYRIPEDWTPEQAEFLSNFLEDLDEAICATYYCALRRLWRERGGHQNYSDLEKRHEQAPERTPETQPEKFEKPVSDDEEIPW